MADTKSTPAQFDDEGLVGESGDETLNRVAHVLAYLECTADSYVRGGHSANASDGLVLILGCVRHAAEAARRQMADASGGAA